MNFADDKELKNKSDELLAFSELLELEIEKAENRHFENTYFVQLPKDEYRQIVQINGIVSFCIVKGHVFDFYDS